MFDQLKKIFFFGKKKVTMGVNFVRSHSVIVEWSPAEKRRSFFPQAID